MGFIDLERGPVGASCAETRLTCHSTMRGWCFRDAWQRASYSHPIACSLNGTLGMFDLCSTRRWLRLNDYKYQVNGGHAEARDETNPIFRLSFSDILSSSSSLGIIYHQKNGVFPAIRSGYTVGPDSPSKNLPFHRRPNFPDVPTVATH
jgi:hypothetical protein